MNLSAQNTTLIPNKTQAGRILELLRERGSAGIPVYELITPRSMGGQGIAQYNARVYELRQKGFNIVNKDNTFYLIEGSPVQFALI
jgi:hypothetical protein